MRRFIPHSFLCLLTLPSLSIGVSTCQMRDHLFLDGRTSDPEATDDSGTGDDSESGRTYDTETDDTCPASLEARLTVTTVSVDTTPVYLRPWYDNALADARLLSAAAADGSAWVAWAAVDKTVHLTPLTVDLTRAGADVVLDGADVGGLAALPDGPAALMLTDDPYRKEISLADDDPTYAVHLVRYRDNALVFDARLTGPSGLDEAPDFIDNFGASSLKWNGETYGAYFQIRGGLGHSFEGSYGDKLLYVNDGGARVDGGFSWACTISYYLRLLPEDEVPFTALCMEDGVDQGGAYVVGLENKRKIAAEEASAGWIGAKFGGIVKLPDSRYLTAWSSLWEVSGNAFDLSLSFLDADRNPTGERRMLTDTPNISEENLHLAPYGDNRILVAYSVYENAVCDTTCIGDDAGMRFRLMDLDGNWIGDPETLAVRPPDEDEMTVFPNGDIVFVFVDHGIAYGRRNAPELLNPPNINELKIARIRYCE